MLLKLLKLHQPSLNPASLRRVKPCQYCTVWPCLRPSLTPFVNVLKQWKTDKTVSYPVTIRHVLTRRMQKWPFWHVMLRHGNLLQRHVGVWHVDVGVRHVDVDVGVRHVNVGVRHVDVGVGKWLYLSSNGCILTQMAVFWPQMAVFCCIWPYFTVFGPYSHPHTPWPCTTHGSHPHTPSPQVPHGTTRVPIWHDTCDASLTTDSSVWVSLFGVFHNYWQNVSDPVLIRH